MIRIRSALCIVSLISGTALLLGCSKKASDEIDFGTVTDSVYRNDYFRLSVVLPPTWSVADQKSRERVARIGAKAVTGDNKEMKAAMKASEQDSVNLLLASEHPMGAPVRFNPSLVCTAERVGDSPGIKRGKDYLHEGRRLLESGQAQFKATFPGEVSCEKLGGVEFDVMRIEISMSGVQVRQKVYASIMKGYALSLTASFATDEQESVLQAILETVRFE